VGSYYTLLFVEEKEKETRKSFFRSNARKEEGGEREPQPGAPLDLVTYPTRGEERGGGGKGPERRLEAVKKLVREETKEETPQISFEDLKKNNSQVKNVSRRKGKRKKGQPLCYLGGKKNCVLKTFNSAGK